MPTTFQTRVEDYVGTISDTDALTDWLTDGAARLVDLLPPHRLQTLATSVVTDSNGVSVSSYRVVAGNKAGVGAREIDPGQAVRAADSASILYATATDPVYYILNGKAYLLPGGGNISAIAKPSVTHSATSISGWPVDMEHTVVLHAAVRAALQKQDAALLDLANVAIGSSTTSTVNPPGAPIAPVISASDAAAVSIDATTISALGTAPSFTVQQFGGDAAIPANLPSLSFSSLTVPTLPNAPEISFSDASLGTWTNAVDIAAFDNPPSLTEASFEGDLAAITSAIPAALDLQGITAPTKPDDPNLATNGITTVSIGSLGTPPTYNKKGTVVFDNGAGGSLTPPTALAVPQFTYSNASAGTISSTLSDLATQLNNASVYSELTSALDTYEDIELAQAKIAEIQTRIQEWRTQAEVTLQRESELARQTLDVNKQNAIEAFRHDVEEYQGTVNRYAQELAKYREDAARGIQKYQLEMQDELNHFNEELEAYRATVQKAVKEAELELARKQAELSATDQMRLQDYVQELNLYDRELALYNAQVDTKVKKFAQDLQRVMEGLMGVQKGYLEKQRVAAEQKIAAFQGAVNIHLKACEKNIAQAQLYQERLATMYKTATDLSIQNEIQTAQTAIANYAQSVAQHQTAVQSYQAQAQNLVAIFEASFRKAIEPWVASTKSYMEKYQLDIQNQLHSFNEELAIYQQDAAHKIKQAELTQQRLIAAAEMGTNVALQNKARALEALISDYKLELELYANQVQAYGVAVNESTQKYQTLVGLNINKYQADIAKVTANVQHYTLLIENLKKLYEQSIALLVGGKA